MTLAYQSPVERFHLRDWSQLKCFRLSMVPRSSLHPSRTCQGCGTAYIFDLISEHISVALQFEIGIAYIWVEPDEAGNEREQFVSFLHVNPIASPRDAIKAALVSDSLGIVPRLAFIAGRI